MPAAISLIFIDGARRRPVSAPGCDGAGLLRPAPEFLQVIKVADLGEHDVHEHIGQVHQDPLSAIHAFDPERSFPGEFAFLDHALRHRLDLPIGVATGDNHCVRDAGQLADVQNTDVPGLQILQGMYDSLGDLAAHSVLSVVRA